MTEKVETATGSNGNLDPSSAYYLEAKAIQSELATIINKKFDTLLNGLRAGKEANTPSIQRVDNLKSGSLGRVNVERLLKEDGESSEFWSGSHSLNMVTKMYSKSSNSNELPDRIFMRRNSLLTEMLKINHIRTIRNIFISIMIIMALQVIFTDVMETGKINYNFDLIFWAFGKFSIVFYTWVYMTFCTSVVVYCGFHYWANHRIVHSYHTIKKNPSHEDLLTKFTLNKYDTVWLLAYVIYMALFIILPAVVVQVNKLPPASAFVVLLEQLRMVMKTHAFVRSNITKAVNTGKLRISLLTAKKHKKTDSEISLPEVEQEVQMRRKLNRLNQIINDHDDSASQDELDNSTEQFKTELILCPGFSSYLYFLFAPTLVYKDNYPRTSRIKWRNVFSHFAQVIGCIIYVYYVFNRFCIPVFQNLSNEHLTLKMFVFSLLNCTLPGTLLLLLAFYGFLHCWLNAFAELLRFGDRMFYKDWWNSTNFSNYYRTWNVVVHDWLYAYIYKDAYYILGKKNRTVCQFIIFFVSALFHEYVLMFGFGFFYPVLFVMFGAVGFFCIFIKTEKYSNVWNLFTWMNLFIGLGGLMCLYSIEWYARQNCAINPYKSSIANYMMPRSLSCYGGDNSSLHDSAIHLKPEL